MGTYEPGAVSEGVTLLTGTAGVPYAEDPDFAQATHVLKSVSGTTIDYQFIKVNETGYWIVGESQDKDGSTSKVVAFTPPLQQLMFPLSFGTQWKSNTTITAPDITTDEDITDTVEAIVDGDGTLITPGSQRHDAVRVKTKLTTTVSYAGTGFSSTTYSFQWYTKDGYGANAGTDKDLRIQNVSYAAPSSSTVRNKFEEEPLSLHLSANPVLNSETNLFFTLKNEGVTQVRLMDNLGRDVRVLQHGKLPAGQNSLPIDVRTLSSGIYFIRIAGDGITATRKLVISK